jgi:hypothetical protein
MIMRLLLPLAILGAIPASASDFCALTVQVRTLAGQPLESQVTLNNESGSVVGSARSLGGAAQFCDMDFGAHSLRVEKDDFFPATVSGIRIRYFAPLLLTVTLNQVPGGDGSTNGCAVDLRVKDSTGKNLPFPSIAFKSTNTTRRGDANGRIATAILLGKERTVLIGAEGYKTTELTFGCSVITRYERTIVLTKSY